MPLLNVRNHYVIVEDFVKPFLVKASRFNFDEEKGRPTGAPEIRESSNEGPRSWKAEDCYISIRPVTMSYKRIIHFIVQLVYIAHHVVTSAPYKKYSGYFHSSRQSKKVSSYIAQYPTFRIAQGVLHFNLWLTLFNRIPSRILWETSSLAAINARRLSVLNQNQTLPIVRYSITQASELEHC